MNIVVLQGMLSTEPVERTLPSGENVMNWVVATETEDGRRSVPVQWSDPSARVRDFVEGDVVVVVGLVRSRFFRAGGALVGRTEVVASSVAKPTQRVTVGRLFEHVCAELTG